MNKTDRLDMIDKLRADNDRDTVEIAQRRAEREASGDFDDVPIITRSENTFQLESTGQLASATTQLTMQALEELADVVGEQTGKTQRDVERLAREVGELRAQLAERSTTRDAPGGFFRKLLTR